MMLPGVFGGLLGLITLPLGGVGLFILPFAFVLFVLGLIGAIWVFTTARAADDI